MLQKYWESNNQIFYIKDLKFVGPDILHQVEKEGIKIYGSLAKRKTNKEKWVKFKAHGIESPTITRIEFSNGCVLLDYSNFDKEEEVSAAEKSELIKILKEYNFPETPTKIIRELLPQSAAWIPYELSKEEQENYDLLQFALKGGANWTKTDEVISFETHIDYHQLYAYIMTNYFFPGGSPVITEGFVSHPLAIYEIGGGIAKLKENGYPLLPSIQGEMAGADGLVFDLKETFYSLCTPDLQLLYENYDVNNLVIYSTLYYPLSFAGKEMFSEVVNCIYNGRKNSTGGVQRFYKLLNQYAAGYFQRTYLSSPSWKTFDGEKYEDKQVRYNPKVGIFITAYGRQRLSDLLKKFDKKNVVGYDTDCVFLNLKKEEIPQEVMKFFGKEMGDLHFDGIYKDVYHAASKYYYGYDLEAQEPFHRQAGLSKTGLYWIWDKKERKYVSKRRGADGKK